MITYKENTRVEKKDLEDLYSSVGWSSYTNDLNTLDKAIQNSLWVITAWDHNRLVGLLRVVGDGETIIYIQDILVVPDFQNQKIGSRLMGKILEKYAHVRQKTLLTEDAPDVRHFYEKFDFVSCDTGSAVAFYKEF